MSTTSISPPTQAPPPRPFLGFEVPRPLRTLVRARESSLAILGAMVGALAGVLVAAMSFGVTLLHALLFGVPPGQRLSSLSTLDPYIAMTVPSLGGLAFGLAFYALGRWRPLREVDPIEANALHGGRMSLFGSLSVALRTAWWRGCDARCIRGPAGGRLLRLRAHHRQLFGREPGAGRNCRAGRLHGGQHVRSELARNRRALRLSCRHPRSRDRERGRAGGGGRRHHAPVRGLPGRSHADLAAPADLSAAGGRRPRRRSARARQPAGSLLRPWRHPHGRHDRQSAAQCPAAVPAQGRGLHG